MSEIQNEMARIPLESEFCDKLEAAHFMRVHCQQTIAMMIDGDYDTTGAAFLRQEKRAMEALAEEEMRKEHIAEAVIPPEVFARAKRWKVDFKTREVVVYG